MEARGPARVDRRLAAILAADVAGYSRLMGTDEEGTLAALKVERLFRHRNVHDQSSNPEMTAPDFFQR